MDAKDLIKLRHELGVTQESLSNRLGLSLRALQNLEGGHSRLRRLHERAIKGVVLDYAIERHDPEILGSLRSGLATLMLAAVARNIEESP